MAEHLYNAMLWLLCFPIPFKRRLICTPIAMGGGVPAIVAPTCSTSVGLGVGANKVRTKTCITSTKCVRNGVRVSATWAGVSDCSVFGQVSTPSPKSGGCNTSHGQTLARSRFPYGGARKHRAYFLLRHHAAVWIGHTGTCMLRKDEIHAMTVRYPNAACQETCINSGGNHCICL
jgi:hypothetical protein